MERDRQYMKYPTKTIQELEFAVQYNDLGYLAGELKTFTMTEEIFLRLCHAAIDISSRATLEWLLDAYYQFWYERVFKDIIRYIMKNKKWQLYSFIDSYIDRVNTKFDEMEKLQNQNGKKKIVQTIQKTKQSLISRFKKYIITKLQK